MLCVHWARRRALRKIGIPSDLDGVLDAAWEATSKVEGFLTESEARLLGTIAVCTPADGVIVEIGSFKGRSTVMLGTVAKHYGLGPIVAIDPHNFNSLEMEHFRSDAEASTFAEFTKNIEGAGVADQIEVRRAFSQDVARDWRRPIRFLWIDGDHSYQGAKTDFDKFFPHVVPGGVVALHDVLHPYTGPIRVFAEDMLLSNQFGAAGLVASIGWSQFRPEDGNRFQKQRARLERIAGPLVPLTKDDGNLKGFTKFRFKLARARVPRRPLRPADWVALLEA